MVVVYSCGSCVAVVVAVAAAVVVAVFLCNNNSSRGVEKFKLFQVCCSSFSFCRCCFNS